MRTTLTTLSVVALLAAGGGTASAQTDTPTARNEAAIHAAAMRAQGLHYQKLAAASADAPAAVPVVRVTHVSDGGFDWADAGIGAGLAAALLLSAAGVAVVRRHQPTMTAR